jgi:hypothetical protein
MHYKNGRPAKNGDKVIAFPGYGPPAIGILYDAVAGNDACNGRIAVIAPNDRGRNGFDGSVRQQCSSGSLAVPRWPSRATSNANDIDRSDVGVHRVPRRARGLRERRRPGRRVTAPTWRTAGETG